MIDYQDPALARIPVLAMNDGYWIDSTHWEVALRQGVLFHDGTKFNATAVKWNVDRMNWFTNSTGNLGSNDTTSSTSSLYMLNATHNIIKSVTIDSEYNVTFELNAPFSGLLDILAYVTGWFLSPTSTPRWTHIPTATGVIVGTGPYKYVHYIADTEVRWTNWQRYWRTGAYFDVLVFAVIEDEAARNNAMLAGDVDVCLGETESLLPTFRADTDITVEDTGAGFSYYYLGMNNNVINVTWREAISYAFNYSYMIDELLQGQAERAYSPLTEAWSAIAGWDQAVNLNSPVFNVTHARRILVEAGITSLTYNLENQAEDDLWTAATLATWNYSYNTDNQFRVDLYPMLRDNLDRIGITVEDGPLTWEEFIYTAYGYNEPGGYDSLQLYWVGWGPDYMNPWNMLDPLFNPLSTSNSAQVDDAHLTWLMGKAITETNPANQTWIFKQILGNLTGRIYAHVYGYHPLITEVYSADLRGYPGNAVNDFWAYPIYREDGITQA
jgi:ABC-type transport system substrate-binding protein